MAARLLLRGSDPLIALRNPDPLEQQLLGRALKRAEELHREELEGVAELIGHAVAKRLAGKG